MQTCGKHAIVEPPDGAPLANTIYTKPLSLLYGILSYKIFVVLGLCTDTFLIHVKQGSYVRREENS